MTQILLALVIGGAFGAVLDRIGASNPNVIWDMLTFRMLGLMKTILLGIGVAAILIFTGQMVGLVDVGHMSIKTAYWGVLFGGLMLGFGWALSGFCPGTGICAAAAGRKDAVFYILGGLAGAGAYILSHDWFQAAGLLDPILGGKSTIGTIAGRDFPALLPNVPGDIAGVLLGLAFVAIAFALPQHPRGGGRAVATPAE